MFQYKYLLIGGGVAADLAAKGIRDSDQEGTIGLVGLETDPPYDRPPLSKDLWKDKSVDDIWRHTDQKGVTLHLGRKIVALDAASLLARDDQGDEYQAEKILLATGGTPRHLPYGGDEIIYYRNLADYRRLTEMAASKQTFAIIGGGFIGAEVAAALAMNGKNVTMIFPEKDIGARIYPADVAQYISGYFRNKGVEVLAEETISGMDPAGDGRSVLHLGSGRDLVVDSVIAGIGITPNLDLAKEAGLKVDKGILVDETMQTSQPNIYAAGDIAEFFSPALGKRIRIEHDDAAKKMGRAAGRNMAGQNAPFVRLPLFYSDLFKLGYEAIGDLNSSLTIYEDWAEPFKKGVIYYFRDDRVCGVLNWNVWEKIPAARDLIDQPGPFRPEDFAAPGGAPWRIAF